MGTAGRRRERRVGQGAEGPLLQIGLDLGELLVVVGDAQLLQIVAAVGGGQQIGGHLGVKDDAAGLDSLVQQPLPQLLGAVDHLFDVRGEQGPEPVVVTLQLTGKQQGSPVLGLCLRPLHTHHVQGGQGQHVHLVKPPP